MSIPPIDIDGVDEAVRLLAAAERPLILAGHGVEVANATAELFSLATRLRIPVATTPKGKGMFPEDHPLSLGILGFTGHARADAYVLGGGIDVMLVVGSGLGETATHSWDQRVAPRRALIHVDVDPLEVGKNYHAHVGIIGDARAVMHAMGVMLDRDLDVPAPPPLDARMRGIEDIERWSGVESMRSEHVPVKPQRVIREMQESFSDDTLLFVDIGNCMAWAGHYFVTKRPNTYFVNLGFGSMGHSVAAAIGARIAAPGRRVVVLTGDAAFMMNGIEVHTAVEYGIDVTWIVMNNGGHGMVHHGEHILRGGTVSPALFRVPVDVAMMARALGARGFKVDSPAGLRAALAESRDRPGPAVIDVRIDADEVPEALNYRARSLTRFFSGLKPGEPDPEPVAVPGLPVVDPPRHG